MDRARPPIAAIASGCNICDPDPKANASGSMPVTAAKAGGEYRINLEICRRTADCVLNAIFDADHAGNLADLVGDAWGYFIQQLWVRGKQLDLDRLGRVREIVDHVLQDLHEFDIEFRFGLLDLAPNVSHDVVDIAASVCF